MSSPQLVIYGAAYGKADVTGKVRSMRRDQKLNVHASNSIFGNTWNGVKKSLVIVYKYEPSDVIKVAIASEGKYIALVPPTDVEKPERTHLDITSLVAVENEASRRNVSLVGEDKLVILGAAYGLADVTEKAKGFVTPTGEFNQIANDSIWDNTSPGTKKTLFVVYTCNGIIMQNIVTEGQTMCLIASPPLTILGAAYGLADVTEKTRELVVSASLSVTASNTTFGDGWQGVNKTLVVVYRYGDEAPKVATAKEGKNLQFMYVKGAEYLGTTNPKTLTILGAAYGPTDVTTKVQGFVDGGTGTLNMAASNSFFDDTWVGTRKSFVVVYRYGRNLAQLMAVPEKKQMTISYCIPPSQSALVGTDCLFLDGDTLTLNALNGKYVTYDDNQQLVATQAAPKDECVFTITKEASDSAFKIFGNNGKYIAVGSDGALYANADKEGASEFYISMSKNGSFRFSTASEKYVRLDHNNIILADAVDYFGADTVINVALYQTPEQQLSLIPRLQANQSLSEYDLACASLIWKLAGGFYLAIGLGPVISTGQIQAGVLSLIKSNTLAWESVQNLVVLLGTGKTKNIKAVIAAAFGVVDVLYKEGLMWKILRIMLSVDVWITLGWAVNKTMQILAMPVVEVFELMASLTVWAKQIIQAVLDVGQANN